MRKVTWLKIINPLIFLLLLSQAVTGMFGEELELSREAFEAIHGMGGVLLVLLSLVHLGLNWPWIKGQYFSRRTAVNRALSDTPQEL